MLVKVAHSETPAPGTYNMRHVCHSRPSATEKEKKEGKHEGSDSRALVFKSTELVQMSTALVHMVERCRESTALVLVRQNAALVRERHWA
eukprot:1157472-Pelagomonas_calceolata.AAC.6